jgi:LuxR family maltose regulon positive regulatory protein
LRSQLWLAQGNLTSAAGWAEHTPYRQEALTGSVYSREYTYLALAHVDLAQHKYQQALQLLAALLESAEQVSRVGSIVLVLALQVAALQVSGSTQKALPVLSRLLPLAEPEGYLRAFLDAGEPMQQVLQAWFCQEQKAVAPHLSAYAHTIFKAFASEPHQSEMETSTPLISPGHLHTLAPSTEHLLEPLTPREQEVLRLLAEGATNQEIAERLVISLTTVKKHVSSLFLKLAAENRTHAVARARELALL